MGRLTKEEFERRMRGYDRHDEEQRRNRQRRSTSDSNAAPMEESNAPKISESAKSKEEACEILDSKCSASERPKDSPQNSRTTTRKLPSLRHNNVCARSKKARSFRLDFSSDDDDDDHDEDLGKIPSPKRRYKRNKQPSPFYRSSDEGSPFKKKYRKDDDIPGCAKTSKRYKGSKKSLQFDDNSDESIDGWKKHRSSRQERITKNVKDRMSLARVSGFASPSSLPLRNASRGIGSERSSGHLDTTFDCSRRNTLEKVSSSSQSQSAAMPPEKTAQVIGENNDETNSDSSWDLMAIKAKRDRAMNLEAKQQETKECLRPDEPPDSPIKNRKKRRRNRSTSFSDEDDEEENMKDGNESFRHRKQITRKRRAMDDENSDQSNESMPKRARESNFARKNKKTRRADSSDSFDDEETDNDAHQTRPAIGQHVNKEPRSSVTSKHNEDYQQSPAEEVKMKKKAPPTSFVDDDDDGFMSDCEPPPTPPTSKSAKKKTTSRHGKENLSGEDDTKRSTKKKKGRKDRAQHYFVPGSVFDDRDSQDDKNHDGSPDDLHPDFQNPKFGPYEPMEPLVLSKDQDGSSTQVPASLNRYLAPFQKEGIRFMYDCLSRNSGVILGDEMGCGKTVQVISLLCALFNKSGTRKDYIDIQDRNSLVREKRMKVQRSKDLALRMGEMFDDDIEDWKTSLSLSRWNPVMIIVPPTIIDTWKNAFKTFSHFSVSFYSGKTRIKAINDLLHGSADILLVPKSAFQDQSHLRELHKVKWKLIVIDEFHNFKNYKAKISIHLRELKELHEPLVLGMTGTLMQNNHMELWNLIDLVETDYFGTREDFKEEIEKPITLGRHKCADPRAKARSEAARAELRKGLDKIYIKRSKKEVLKGQLPEKNEDFILCDLSPLQKEVYRHVIQLPDFDLVKHGSRPCDCGVNLPFFRDLLKLKGKAEQLEYMRRNKSNIEKQSKCCKIVPLNPRYSERVENSEPKIDQDAAIWRTLDRHCTNDTIAEDGCERCPWCCTLPCLTKLNKLSSHLGLLQAKKTTEAVGSPAYITYMKDREFAKVALAGVVDRLPGRDYDRNDGIMDDHFSLSGKLRVLNNLLQKNYDEGAKVLLFAHSTQSLDLIENWLKSRGSFEYSRMDGSTPLSRRQYLTDEFNNTDHIFLFLLSIKATGLGLNLTSANRVIMFDVSWNPSWEIQAQDRAHRIGQTRDVHVFRLISKGTVEEMIYLRQIYKEHLKQDTLEEDDGGEAPRVFRGVQGDKWRKGELFGTENLFRFKEDGSFLQDIYNVRPKSRNKGDTDSSGLELLNSVKVSEVLLGMTDKDREKIGDGDALAAIQCLPVISDKNTQEEAHQNIRPQEPQSTDEELAINHRDLFRSDRGGAAIKPGEDGFDEEMGGQTQAAYELYDNMKDNFGEEGGSDAIINDDQNIGNQCGRNHSDLALKVALTYKVEPEIRGNTVKTEPETWETIVKTESEPMENAVKAEPTPDPIVSSKQTIAQTISDRNYLSERNVAPSATVDLDDEHSSSKEVPKSYPGRKLDVASKTPVQESRRSESFDSQIALAKEFHVNSSKKRNRTKKKVLLMGCTNLDGAKTKFSAADLRRPEYGKKKKKKKKKIESKTT